MLDGGEYSPSETEIFSCINIPTTPRKRSMNKSRFSDEQIRSLESIFESESRLEPAKKLRLAKELGLRPRQVAIWFQNKRARWKSKQIERDYNILQASYNSLAARFENLRKEKQDLVIQLQKLNDLIQKTEDEGPCCGQGVSGASSEGESDNGNTTNCESDVKADLSFERSEQGLGVLSAEDTSIKADCFGLEEPNLISIVEAADGSLTSQDFGSLDAGSQFDQSSGGCQWWDFWA